MSAPYEITLSSSDIIAIAAVLFSGFSALYARWAASEARRANEISLLTQRKVIYDAFDALNRYMAQRATRFEMKQISEFQHHARDASLYFPKPLSQSFTQYYNICNHIATLATQNDARHPNHRAEIKREMVEAAKLAKVIDQEISDFIRKST